MRFTLVIDRSIRRLIFAFGWIVSVMVLGTFGQSQPLVEWKPLNIDGFYAQMPEGFAVSDHGGFTAARSIRVRAHKTVYRNINGTLLIIELYQGDVRRLHKAMTSYKRTSKPKKERVLGNEVVLYSTKSGNSFYTEQQFLLPKALIIVKSYALSESDRIANDFLGSVRLTDGTQVVAPNLPKEADLEKANIIEPMAEIPAEIGGEDVIVEGDLDRPVVLLYSKPPDLSRVLSSGRSQSAISGLSTRIRYRVVYASTGKVTKVTFNSPVSSEMLEALTSSANNTQFIPAMKNGRFVSTYRDHELGLSSSR